jgi:hypothetical protein
MCRGSFKALGTRLVGYERSVTVAAAERDFRGGGDGTVAALSRPPQACLAGCSYDRPHPVTSFAVIFRSLDLARQEKRARV